MTSIYGENYGRLSTGNPNVITSYPDYVMTNFPWIRWYTDFRNRQNQILIKIGGDGTTKKKLATTTSFFALMPDGYSKPCNQIWADDLARHLLEVNQRR